MCLKVEKNIGKLIFTVKVTIPYTKFGALICDVYPSLKFEGTYTGYIRIAQFIPCVIYTTLGSFLRSSRPSEVFYSGEVKGESAIEYEEEIGSQVEHSYEVSTIMGN